MLESLFRYSCKLKACCFILTLSKLMGGGWKFSKNIFSRERDFWTYEDFPVLTIFVNYLEFLTFSCYKNTSHMVLENRSIRRAVFCKNNLLQDVNKFYWKVSVMESLFSKTVKKTPSPVFSCEYVRVNIFFHCFILHKNQFGDVLQNRCS